MSDTATLDHPTRVLDPERLEAFLGQVVADFSATESTAASYLGDRLGLYDLLASLGAVRADDLATRTGLNPRLLLEWLRGQVAGGYLLHDANAETYELPPEHAAVLCDESSPALLSGILDIIASMWADVAEVEQAMRGDGGIHWGAHDHRLFQGVARLFGPIYDANLVAEWLPALDGVTDKLIAGARVADLGCGWGRSTVTMAQSFPRSTFVGYDLHRQSIDEATASARAVGVGNNTEFHVLDASGELPDGGFDLACFFDALHDMGDPVAAATRAREALADDGTLLVVEPAAGDTLMENLNPVSRLYYAGSLFLCTPSALAQNGPLALGAQAGPAALTQVLQDAGFGSVRVAWSSPFNFVLEARA